MRYLFWNTNRKDVDEIIYNMVLEYEPTIFALAEYEKQVEELVKNIKIHTDKNYVLINKFACRVQIIINEKLIDSVKHCADHTNYTIKIIPYNSFHDDHIVAYVGDKEKFRWTCEM